MKTRNIAVEAGLHQKYKIIAAQVGCDLHELIAAALTEWMTGELWRPWARLHLEKNIKAVEPVAEAKMEPKEEEVKTIGSRNFVAPPGMEHMY